MAAPWNPEGPNPAQLGAQGEDDAGVVDVDIEEQLAAVEAVILRGLTGLAQLLDDQRADLSALALALADTRNELAAVRETQRALAHAQAGVEQRLEVLDRRAHQPAGDLLGSLDAQLQAAESRLAERAQAVQVDLLVGTGPGEEGETPAEAAHQSSG